MAQRILKTLVACGAAAYAAASEGACTGEQDEACGLADAEHLVQRSVKRSPWLDVYVTTAETVEDVMYWAVLYKSMKPYYHSHPHWLLIRHGSEVMKRAHAIRMAIGQNFWHARVDVFEPKNLNLQSVDVNSWRQLAPFQYNPDEYRRVVNIDADSLVFRNIDGLTHRIPHMILATDQGDCKNLTHALLSQTPATNLYSMVPDTSLVNLMTTATVRLAASDASVQQNVSHASLISRAFSKVHPEKEKGSFPPSEVVSASCLMHHRDQVLRNKNVLDSMAVMHLGEEGKALINDIIAHGEKRLVNTINGLQQAGKSTLANAIRTWFEAFSHESVMSVIDAAKNGPLAES